VADIPAPNALAGIPLDRLGHRRGESAWLRDIGQSNEVVYLLVQEGRNLVHAGDPPRPAFLSGPEASALKTDRDDAILLGRHESIYYFALPVAEQQTTPATQEFRGLRGLAGNIDGSDAALLAYARAMVLWHRNHPCCARCGAPSRSIEAGHARLCTRSSCGTRHFPRVDPAIIVLVTLGESCLLGRQPDWPAGRYSTIAGFVEPGESLEEAVIREVREETGVDTVNPRYHSSQPWPFPSSLMLGYFARAVSEDISLLDGELEDARWVTRADIAAGRVLMPTPFSIAYALVKAWYEQQPGADLERDTAGQPAWWRPSR
jgi:NAD+ diphosphatase